MTRQKFCQTTAQKRERRNVFLLSFCAAAFSDFLLLSRGGRGEKGEWSLQECLRMSSRRVSFLNPAPMELSFVWLSYAMAGQGNKGQKTIPTNHRTKAQHICTYYARASDCYNGISKAIVLPLTLMCSAGTTYSELL